MDLMQLCQEVLQEEGFFVRNFDEDLLHVKAYSEDVMFQFIKEKPTYLRAYVVFGGNLVPFSRTIKLEAVSSVSLEMKVAKAYIDEEGDIMITVESFVDVSSVSAKQIIIRLLQILLEAVATFTSFLDAKVSI